jgi:DNA-binding FadR family transcriptional regulator
LNLAGQFFSDTSLISTVFEFHRELVLAIKGKKIDQATNIMEQTLTHGENHLKRLIENL